VVRGCDSEQAREAKNMTGLPMLEKLAAKLRPELRRVKREVDEQENRRRDESSKKRRKRHPLIGEY